MIIRRERTWCGLVVMAIGWNLIGYAAADDPVLPLGSEEEIARLIRQLDSDTFAERQEASVELGELGAAAFDALAEAAIGDSLEVTERAIALLQRQWEAATDEATRRSAEAALRQIAGSDRPAAARRAKKILSPPEPPPVQNPIAQLAPGAIQIAVAANAGARRITVRQINGQRTLEVFSCP